MANKHEHSERGTSGSDFVQFYCLESYLFGTVHQRFAEQSHLNAFDFFCIVIWKANRAKTRIAKRLLGTTQKTLDEVVVELTKNIAAQKTLKDKMRLLMNGEVKFRLPMASAILTVLYPDDFTIYDVRVCGSLGDFHKLATISNFDELWIRYVEFKVCVDAKAPQGYSLRDKDRYLWGKSFHAQLCRDIGNGFGANLGEIGSDDADGIQ
jgi:hypothetical protein